MNNHLLRLLALLLAATALLRAHGHLDVRPDGNQANRLTLEGSVAETAVYVPPGEPFSGYAPLFPGGYYASELTFSHEDPDGSLPRSELVSVEGPAGATFAFWEVNATAPTWSRPTGWTAAEGDRPSFAVYEDGSGYGHIHGRLFTTTHPGTYTVTFRAVDENAAYLPSPPLAVTFTVHATPPLALSVVAGQARLTFTSRAGLTYDLQVSTDLATWTTVPGRAFISGTGAQIDLTDSIANRPRVFYRLVEYF